MLRVRTRLQKSEIHGLGVIADEPIERGRVIWEFDEGLDCVLTEEALCELPEVVRRWIEVYSFQCKQTGVFVICLDDGRFMNHSSAPNTINEQDGHYTGRTIALRDIGIGEEITVDYLEFDGKAHLKF